jgi:RES domain-containing protein
VIAQILDRTLAGYRIGDPDGAHRIFDAAGSRLYPGRWNTPASPVIYASEHYSTALLEKLVRGSGRLPPNQHYVQITIPAGASHEVVDVASMPGWDTFPPLVSKDFGEAWQRSKRSLLLLVPSIVARLDLNVIINPEHPEFPRVQVGLHLPVHWDRRLFGEWRAKD